MNYLMTEVCKYLHGLSPDLMTDSSEKYNIRNIRLFGSENPRLARFGVHVIATSASQ